jgi:hypothetical protein
MKLDRLIVLSSFGFAAFASDELFFNLENFVFKNSFYHCFKGFSV